MQLEKVCLGIMFILSIRGNLIENADSIEENSWNDVDTDTDTDTEKENALT